MKIDLNKKQYSYLMKSLEISSSIYGLLGDWVSENYKKQSDQIEKLQTHLLEFARDFGMENITEKYKGELIISEDYYEKLHKVIDDYEELTFWDQLEVNLGKRDFENTITKSEKAEIKINNGWYPERIQELYNKWRKEFEENGIKRLTVLK